MDTTKTALGIAGATFAATLTVGVVSPAVAAEHGEGGDVRHYAGRVLDKVDATGGLDLGGLDLGGISNESPVVVAPEVGVGDVASGNEVDAPVLSGNETAVGSGNDTSVGTDVSDVVDVSDLADDITSVVTSDVSDLLDDLDLGSLLD